MRKSAWIISACGALFALHLFTQDARETRALLPRPTEHVLDDDAEARHKAGRKRWMKQMHRAAADVDWQEIERRNGRAEMERRRVLSSDMAMTAGSSWAEIGSKNLAGRTRSSFIGPSGEDLYAGSALGGLWRGSLNGTNWEPLGDNLYGGVDTS